MKLRSTAIFLALALVACSPTTGSSVGVVTEVEGSLTEVESFTILTDGNEVTLVPIEAQDYEFPLDHLREHLLSGEPIAVEWEIRDDIHYALAITDD